MSKKHIGFLNPGAMGISLAATAQNSGHSAYWVSKDRGPETRGRAEEHALIEVRTMQELCETCSVIICICPPYAAPDVAKQVLDCAYQGIYADVNAISPKRSTLIGQMMAEQGVDYVDGGIIGGPAWKPATTWLYLSGSSAEQVAECFSSGPLATEVIGTDIGKASALKMCFAANTKGTTALLCAIVAAAERLGVRKELEKQWSRGGADFAESTFQRIRGVTTKAWRFSGEMQEIASTLGDAGLPKGFHLAAYDIYERIAAYKGADPVPALAEVLEALLSSKS